jgi:hypothetical protein
MHGATIKEATFVAATLTKLICTYGIHLVSETN